MRLGFREFYLGHLLVKENEKVKEWERKLVLPLPLFFKQLSMACYDFTFGASSIAWERDAEDDIC